MLVTKIETAMKTTGHEKLFRARATTLLANWKKLLARQYTVYKSDFQRNFHLLAVTKEYMDSILASLKSGYTLEHSLADYTIHACMKVHQMEMSNCQNMTKSVCAVVKNVFSSIAMNPNWLLRVCPDSGVYVEACVANFRLDQAALRCGSSARDIGLEMGIGAAIYEAKAGLQALHKEFDILVKIPPLTISSTQMRIPAPKEAGKRSYAGVSGQSGLENHHTSVPYHKADRLTSIYHYLVVISTLLRLSFVVLLYKAQRYIAHYLLDDHFDNLYAGKQFEAIEVKRRREHRDNVLPLKKLEASKVYWRRRCCTCGQFWTILCSLCMAILLGCALLLVFLVDLYIYELIALLYHVTRSLRERVISSESSPGHVSVKGGGFFHSIVSQLLGYLHQFAKVDLNYDATYCSPFVFITHLSHKSDFYQAWGCLLLVILCSQLLLRVRHTITAFFYPARSKQRAVHLYNSLLLRRKAHMNACRNYLLHVLREGRFKTEIARLTAPNLLTRLCPRIANLLALNKVTCILCHDRLNVGPTVYVCPIDGAVTCGQCMTLLPTKAPTCLVCLERDPEILLKQRRKSTRMEDRLSEKLIGMDNDFSQTGPQPYFQCLTKM